MPPAPRITAVPSVVAAPTVQAIPVTGQHFKPGLSPSLGTASSVTPTTCEWHVALPDPGIVELSLRNPDGKVSNVWPVVVAPVIEPPDPPDPPLPPGAFGPQPGIAPPPGAIEVTPRPSSELQATLAAHPEGTTFWLRAGLYPFTSAVRPKSDQVLIGEYGATFDGSGWATTDQTQAAIRAHNEAVDRVTLRNLAIRHMPQKGIHAFKDFSRDWRVEQCEISWCKTGVSLSSGAVVADCAILHNVDDPTNPDAGRRGGGYAFYIADNVQLIHNEIAWNGPEQKSIDSTHVVMRDNWAHHNLGAGLWNDGNGEGSIVEGNLVEDNGAQGIFWEMSQKGVIRHNRLYRNKDQAIFLSTSNTIEVASNEMLDNFRAVTLFINCAAVGTFPWHPDLHSNHVHDNQIRVTGAAQGALGCVFSWTTCSEAALQPYLDNTVGNRFERNAYLVEDVSGTAGWFWVGGKTWQQWRAMGFDLDGTVEQI